MASQAMSIDGTKGGANVADVRVLEQTVESKVMEALGGVLPKVIHRAVHAALEATASAPSRRRSVRNESTEASRPKAGGRCDAVWKELDKRDAASGVPTLREILRVGQRRKWNPNNTRVEYYNWRKAKGISGRLPVATTLH